MSQKELSQEHKAIIGPADLYERDKVPSLFRPLALQFLEYVPLQRGATVLDIACGTGIVARLVSERIGPEGTVTGVDIDPDMLAVAQAQVPANRSIKWHVGNAEEMPFIENESFDWVVCQQGFQYFSDKSRALQEIHRVLRKNGRLAIIMARSVDAQNQPCQWAEVEAFRKHVSAEAGEKQRTLVPFYDGNEEDLQMLISTVGFRDVTIHNIVHRRQRGNPEEFITEEDYSNLDEESRTAIVSDIRKAMEPYRTEDGTAVPYGFHIALGDK
jgi:ubiquinone/menaquinone biosynthesis C-methylase UbiE